VTVSDRNDADSLEDVACRSFTVVGYGGNPMYMGMNRSTTSVGSGVLKAFLYVPQEAFSADYYSEIHLTLPEEHPVYSESYNAYLDHMTDALEPEAERLGQMRYDAIKAEVEAEYQDGYQEYLDGLKEFEEEKADAEKELADAYQELKDAEEELEEGDIVYIYPKKNRASRKTPYHYFRRGETARGIAQRYGIKMKSLYKINGIPYGVTLKTEQRLYLR
jgi:putative ABC transport system permease protein